MNKKKELFGSSKETYWDYVGEEAKARVGNNMQLKGIIHEIAIRDSKNISFQNILEGKVTRLTKSTTAKSVDIVTLKNGKIVERIQAKDLTNSSSITVLKQKIKSNQYKNSKLVGTYETTNLYNKASKGVGKKMESSNISSTTTTRVAHNAGVNIPNKDVFINNLKDINVQAKQSAIISASIGGAFSIFNNGKKLMNNEIVVWSFLKKH